MMVSTWAAVVDSSGIRIQRRRKHIFWLVVCGIVATSFLQYALDSHPLPLTLLGVCEEVDVSKLRAHIPVVQEARDWADLERELRNVSMGGRWSPAGCRAVQDVALYLPFRDRDEHLRVFLAHMHPFLQRQGVAYTIYTVEPDPRSVFNRGLLGNVGFVEASRVGAEKEMGQRSRPHDCFIFHDVDLLPENEQNRYQCGPQPRHLSTLVDSLGYALPYKEISGGIGAFRPQHLRSINGFSNYFFRWGGEDDDLFGRFHSQGWTIQRDPNNTGKYTQLKHAKAEKNPLRFAMITHNRKLRQRTDGLNSVHDFYTLQGVVRHKLYTQIKVKVNDKKADFVINSIVQEIRQGLPNKYKSINASLIIQAVQRLGMFYTKPIQAGAELKKMLAEMHIQL